MHVARHVIRNRTFWDADAADYQAVHGDALGAAPLAWGVWRIPETEVRALGDPAALRGLSALELGCGAAQFAVELRTAGVAVTGLDVSTAQLSYARRAAVDLPLIAGDAEHLPFGDQAFDLVFCDHGAMSFCDPDLTLPEVARVLRPGGRLVFSMTTPWVYLTYDDERERQTRKLQHNYFGMLVFSTGEGTTDFQIPYGEWIRAFNAYGFDVRDLIELRAPDGATTTYDFAPEWWARRWPAEQIWVVAKRV